MEELETKETGFETYQQLFAKLLTFANSTNLPALWTYFGEQKTAYGEFRNVSRKFSNGVEVWKKRLEELKAPEWEMNECESSLEMAAYHELQRFLKIIDREMSSIDG